MPFFPAGGSLANGLNTLTATANTVAGWDGNGNPANLTSSQIQQLAQRLTLTNSSIDALTPGDITIGTVPAGAKYFYITSVKVTCITTTGLIGNASIGIGTSVPSNLANSVPITGMIAANNTFDIPLNQQKIRVAGSTVINANITVAATGTALVLQIDVDGYFK